MNDNQKPQYTEKQYNQFSAVLIGAALLCLIYPLVLYFLFEGK